MMSVTSIQFIGLFVVMMNSGAGLHILLPHFPGTPFRRVEPYVARSDELRTERCSAVCADQYRDNHVLRRD